MRKPHLHYISLHSLGHNAVGAEGVAAIEDALKQNKTLTTLQ
jgi:hypothetical protein